MLRLPSGLPLLSLLASLLLAGTLPASAAHPLRFQDLIGFGRVSDPQISPDGQWVAYVVDTYDLPSNQRTSSLWLASLASGENHQLTRPPPGKRDRRPRWSPEGTTVAFLSNRSGSWQVWAISPAGGEAWPYRELGVDVDHLKWSPDGNWLAFTAEVYPECPDTKAESALECTKKRDQQKDASPVKARLYDQLLYRHWDSWSEGKRSHVFVMAVGGEETSTPRDLTPGEWSVPPFSLGGPDDFAFSPDSQELSFARNTDPNPAWSTNSDLWVVPLRGGTPTKITSNPAWDGSPLYSPDGRWIAYRAQARPGFEADRFRLLLYERATGEIRDLTPTFDHWVNDFVWTPDSQTLYFTASVGGQGPIYEVSLADGSVREVMGASNHSQLQLTSDGNTLVFARESFDQPAEIFSADRSGERVRTVSRRNQAALSEIEMRPGESFWVKGAEGTPVQSWLIKPPGFDPQKRYPVVFLIHGGPQGTWMNGFHYRWNAQLFAAPGYIAVLPNPRGSPGWGQTFIDEISGDYGGKVFVDIMNVVDYVEQLPFVDKGRMCLGGGSYGGYMTNWVLGHTDRFRCLFSHAGVFNTVSKYGATEELWFPEWDFQGTPWTNREMYERWSPHNFVAHFKTPTLVIHGALDYRVPLEQGLGLFTSLQRQGVASQLLYYPDEGHWILKPQNAALWYKTVQEWLATYLR